MQDRGEKPSLGRVREAVRVAIGDIERLFAVRCLLFAVCCLLFATYTIMQYKKKQLAPFILAAALCSEG